MTSSSLASVRAVTTSRRPPGNHGCPGVEIIPGLWTAHFHDIETTDALRAVAPPVTVVVNVGTDKCPVVSYGDGVRVVAIDLLDDPDELKAADNMPDGSDKDGVKSALLERLATGDDAGLVPCGDARKDFETVNSLVDETLGGGGAVLIHCHASISRSAAFVLAYVMKTQRVTLAEATALLKSKWDACWPADSFVLQLIEYEKELGL